jgi:hypothetical protein
LGAEATKGDGPLQGGEQWFATVGRFHGGELVEVAGQGGDPGCGGGLDEGFGRRSQRTERDLRWRLGSDRSSRSGARAAVVVVVDGGLTRGDDAMFGDDGAQEHDLDDAVGDADLDLAADVAGGDRVAGRPEPDAAETVDLADDELADLGPQRRQWPQQFAFSDEPLSRDRAYLGVDRGVDLRAPDGASCVGGAQIGNGEFGRDHEVGLRVADEVLDEAFGLGVVAFAEVGPEPVVGREADVVGGRHHQAGDSRALEAPHAV